MRIPSVKLISGDMSLVGEIAMYTSLVFTRKWQSPGEFVLTAPHCAVGSELLRHGQMVMLDEDGHASGIVQDIGIAETPGGAVVTAKGGTLSEIANWRLTVPPDDALNMGYDNVPPVVAPGVFPSPIPAESVLKEYARRHLKSGDPARDIPYLHIAPSLGRGTPTMKMARFEPLAAVLQAVAEYCDIGWEIWLDWENRRLVFDAVPGRDLSHVSGNEFVVFSLEFASVGNLDYTKNTMASRNVGYVGGDGQDEDRLIQTVWEGSRPEGLDRRETFIDAGALGIADGLVNEGLHRLKGFVVQESLSGQVVSAGAFKYRRDWDLGDLVTVRSERLGIEVDARVTQVRERYESKGLGVEVVFGTPPDNISRTIRRVTQRNVR